MNARLSPEREAEIAARAEAATPGPWGTHRDLDAVYTIQARPRTTRDGMENDGDIATLAVGRLDAEGYANARFAAHAREDVPALLAELAAVRAERDRYRAAWQSASFRAEARGEGILRITRDRETYQGWLEQEQAVTQQLRVRIAELEAANAEAVGVSESLYRRLSDGMLAGSALYAALTMPTTPEQRQAALDKFKAVAHREEPAR
ncbi:hypothetical protein [Streptomyces rochei]|uniref:hypothetical protein n=1 Tax=Streptomyces rochei TaxID=1928 RepID=UPI00403A4770